MNRQPATESAIGNLISSWIGNQQLNRQSAAIFMYEGLSRIGFSK